MALTAYTRTISLLAAPITAVTPTHVTAGSDTYPVPGAWGTRKPLVGDWLIQLPSGVLAWLPVNTLANLDLVPLAGPFNVGDRVICPRADPPIPMTVASITPDGYNCSSPTGPLMRFYVPSDLQAAP